MSSQYREQNVVPLLPAKNPSIRTQVSGLKDSLFNLLTEHERLVKLQLGSIKSDMKVATAAGALAQPFSAAGLIMLGSFAAMKWTGDQLTAGTQAFADKLGIVGAILFLISLIFLIVSSVRMKRMQETLGDIATDISSDVKRMTPNG